MSQENVASSGEPPGPHFTNGPSVPPRFPTITAAILHHVFTIPDQVAAIDHSNLEPRTITYGELGNRAAHLAKYLRSVDVRPGDRVPFVARRGLEMLVGIVAVLCCGAQYVPLDGKVAPKDTIRRVVEQSGSGVVLCLEETAHRVTELEMEKCMPVAVEEHTRKLEPINYRTYIEETLVGLTTEESGCYVIYTSGTTGRPKGVDVTHSNVANLVCSEPGSLGIRQGVRVGHLLSISFDMAAWEVLGCVSNGGTLVMRGSDWERTIREVEVLICTPSILSRYSPEQFPNLRTVATAGEPISAKMAGLWASHLTYWNGCGPTETTIVNTMQRHSPGRPLSVGGPTPNNTCYILNSELKPVPIGTPGTIWAGGKGVSRGYVGLPELTNEKYVPDKFANDGTMMYNTGDIGLWLRDGTIQIQGRRDDQVKIKGFRVELDGIAACLCTAQDVTKAIVLLIDGKLHAFIQSETCDVRTVRESTKTLLPYYAQPSQYHILRSLPLTQNGKVDKKALQDMAENETEVIGSDDGTDEPPAAADAADHRASHRSTESNTSNATTTTACSSTELLKKEKVGVTDKPVPDKALPQPFRGLIYRVFIPYRFLFSLVYLANIGAAIAVFMTGPDRDLLGTMVAVNLALAVLIRQDFVINAVYTVSCNFPKTWPLWLRASAAKIFHLGGVHSSAASCAALWLLVSNITDAVCLSLGPCQNYPSRSIPYTVLSWMLTAMFMAMLTFAYPGFRKANHNFFERFHRFTGWSMLALFWAQTMVNIHDTAVLEGTSFTATALPTPAVWLLSAATGSVALSWCFLRRVPVISEVLSDHAIRLHFDYTVPVNGSFSRLSFRPLVEWHSFATIPAPKPHGPPEDPERFPAGYSLVVSNAGDWTRHCIKNPPRHLWVRGVPTCGVMRIATLFNRVVVVATGSGIGPCLGHLQAPSCPTGLLWSTRDPNKTFGPGIVNSIKEKMDDFVIWDTKAQGRPDMVRLSYNMAKDFDAEAVIIIANEKITKKVVYGLETRGIPAYGAIWDS